MIANINTRRCGSGFVEASMMRIVVAGVPGVGKSTCMQAASEAKNLKIMNFGSMMIEAARIDGIGNRDELRRMDLDVQKKYQKIAADNLAKEDDIIIDTHVLIQTPFGYFPGLPVWVLEKLKPDIIFLIEASPREIITRRRMDPSRKRDEDNEEEVDLHQRLNRVAAVMYAVNVGATVKRVVNADGKVDEAVKEVHIALKVE